MLPCLLPGCAVAKIVQIETALKGHLVRSPLSEDDADAVDAALLASKRPCR